MSRHKMFTGPIDRVVIKLPRELAAFFRKNFKHGQRSLFVANCIREFQRDQEINEMEENLRSVHQPRHQA